MKTNRPSKLLRWWRIKRVFTRAILERKKVNDTLTEVEKMILNPYTLEQARNQVKELNGGATGIRKREPCKPGTTSGNGLE